MAKRIWRSARNLRRSCTAKPTAPRRSLPSSRTVSVARHAGYGRCPSFIPKWGRMVRYGQICRWSSTFDVDFKHGCGPEANIRLCGITDSVCGNGRVQVIWLGIHLWWRSMSVRNESGLSRQESLIHKGSNEERVQVLLRLIDNLTEHLFCGNKFRKNW